jgi:hypothetical protein
MNHSIDIVRLTADLERISAEIRALKDALRQTWTRPMAVEQQQLVRSKRRATELCVLRAGLRGRFHLTLPPPDSGSPGTKWDAGAYRSRVMERLAPEYQLAKKAS